MSDIGPFPDTFDLMQSSTTLAPDSVEVQVSQSDDRSETLLLDLRIVRNAPSVLFSPNVMLTLHLLQTGQWRCCLVNGTHNNRSGVRRASSLPSNAWQQFLGRSTFP
ncbi:hypothetical protein TNCV_993381 [Trichonephila clavipes]|nr:hypothetical protein TNCV_993381 [Trichonephila clavipes]